MKKCFAPIPLAALFLFSGCNYFKERTVAAEELSKTYTRTATQAGEVTDAFKTAASDFAVKLFQKTLTKDRKNDLVSPLSALSCIALVNNGASGNTRAQIEDMVGLSAEELNHSLYAYTSSLYSGENCEVRLANSIWFRENKLNVLPEFLQTNADWLGAQAYATPFNGDTVKDINNWCYNQTKGKIDKIINTIEPETMMYLINALDFEAKWAKKYERGDIENGIFHGYNGTDKDVKMLYSEQSEYISDEYAVGFTRPYEGKKYSFVALLPNEDVDVYEYAKSLTGKGWQTLWETQEYREIHARIPEFTYEVEFSLKSALQALGVTDMFSENANFSNIGNTNTSLPLYCEDVKQKTMIELDRNGTKAAAITWAGMGAMSAAPAEKVYITLDRPFIYAIVDRTHTLPLFFGLVDTL